MEQEPGPSTTQPLTTQGQLHAMELRLIKVINDLALRLEQYQGSVGETARRALSVANDANETAKTAHTRIDSLQKLGLTTLIAWLATALAAGWGLWSTLQAVRQLR